ncbi:MAG: D-2-hydroxyacid dehydrogenase [Acidobacteria bacterium]|nr:D-2-hydroxyacid dehydrogenase [Acidobacteriota bacterium]MBS1864766.1 D-2-hydroxyacid dehydrogenase [Acidobacteriota bacterium]
MKRTKPSETKLVICVWHPFRFWRPDPAMAETLRAKWPEMRVVHLPNYDVLPPELPDTDIFVGYSLRADQLTHARKLKWIHSTATGVAQLMYPELRESGILVTNPRGVFSVPVAEHTLGMMIAMARNFPDSIRFQDQAKWSQQQLWDLPQQLSELSGKTLLIVGFGSIGQELAKRAKAFDMRVLGVTRSGQSNGDLAEKIVAGSELHSVLPEADYAVIAVPETAGTKKLMGAAEISRMKRGARLINVGRGSLLDEDALIAALESGHLAGAGLDVTGIEPLPENSPLWKAPNLFITPHTSGVSNRLWQRETALLVELLELWFSGQSMKNVVDLSRGY